MKIFYVYHELVLIQTRMPIWFTQLLLFFIWKILHIHIHAEKKRPSLAHPLKVRIGKKAVIVLSILTKIHSVPGFENKTFMLSPHFFLKICIYLIITYCRYACSKSGHIFEIDHRNMCIFDVHRLLPRLKDGEKQTMSSSRYYQISSFRWRLHSVHLLISGMSVRIKWYTWWRRRLWLFLAEYSLMYLPCW